MTGLFRAQRANVGALATAAVVTLGVVTVPPERYSSLSVRADAAAVQLQIVLAAEISALVNSSAGTAATAAAESSAVDALTTPVTTGAAATGGVEGILTSVGAGLANLVGTLLSPVWFLAFPITIPIAIEIYRQQNPVYNPIAIINLFGWFTTWTQLPFNVSSYLFPATDAQAAATLPPAFATADPPAPVADSNTAGTQNDIQDSPVTPSAATETGPSAVTATTPWPASSTAATSGGDILATLGFAAATVAGIALAPLWYLAFPITIPLTIAFVTASIPSSPGDYGIGAFQRALGAVLGWVGFPLALGSLLFPQVAANFAEPTPSASIRSAESSLAEAETASAATDLAVAASTSVDGDSPAKAELPGLRNARQRGSAQRGKPVAQSSATTTVRADAPPVAGTVALTPEPSDVAGSQTAVDLDADSTSVDVADTDAKGPSAAAFSRSDAANKSTHSSPRQRAGKAPSASGDGRATRN